MRIFYPAFVRLPTEKAHGAQIIKTCEALADVGAHVELAIPGRKTHLAEDLFDYYGADKNFKLTVHKTPDFVSWGPLGFIFSLLWFSELIKWAEGFWKADIIYSRDAALLLQYILLGRRLVYEAHMKPTFISTFVAKHSHKVVVISENLRDAYEDRGIARDKLIIAHDAVDLKSFEKEYDQKQERIRLGIPVDKKIALYVGRIDSSKGANTFAAASEYLDEDTLCVLIGAGPLVHSLKKRFDKALFLPPTPYGELARVLAVADVLVLPNSTEDETYAQYTSPLKAFAYLASKKPVVSSDVPALKNILKNRAIYFSADNPEQLAASLRGNYVKNDGVSYTWHNRASTILSSLGYV